MHNINNIEIKISNNLVDYTESLKIMEKRVVDINLNNKKELIWFLYHDHIYTIGTSGSEKEIREKITYPVIKTNRGGKITYHGPGQKIIYLMLNLRKKGYDIRKFITLIEEWIIISLKDIGVKGINDKDHVGIWVEDKNTLKKISSIGLRVRKGITFHGVSINMNPNLENFKGINPCGNNPNNVTSLEELGLKKEIKYFDDILIRNFNKLFKAKLKLRKIQE